MKKFTILTLFTAFLLVGVTANAQEQGEIRVSLGLTGNTTGSFDDSNGEHKLGFGIDIGGEYFITDAISIAPSYNLGFNTETEILGETLEYKVNFFNIDARYYFGESGFYGLAGLGIVTLDVGETDSETGLNLGAGYMYELSDAILLNGQLKFNTVQVPDFTLEESSSIVFQVGASYRIGG